MFHVFLKVFIWILNLYFCFHLDDLDIGDFIDDITATDYITKYKLLRNHFKPDHNYKFPSKFQHECMRALTYHWLASIPFLVNSKRYDPVFCLPCTLFGKSEISEKSKFSKNTGFSSWFKISEKVSKPLSCEETCEKNISNYSKHSVMMAIAECLIQRFQNPTATIPYNFEATREIQICKNRQILKWVIKTIILCGKQCIALRGHREYIHNSSNKFSC